MSNATLLNDLKKYENQSLIKPNETETLLKIIKIYEKLGFYEEIRCLYKRYYRYYDISIAITPCYLDIMLRKNRLQDVLEATIPLKNIGSKTLDMSKSLAKAFTINKQIDAAMKEWKHLINSNNMTEEEWHYLAKMMLIYENNLEIKTVLKQYHKTKKFSEGGKYEKYCIFKINTDINDNITQNFLSAFEDFNYDDLNIAFDLGIYFWRFGFYDKAEHIFYKSLLRDKKFAKVFRNLLFSFQGKDIYFENSSTIFKPVVELLIEETAKTPKNYFKWGYITLDKNERYILNDIPFQSYDERSMILSDNNILWTYSILPGVGIADPLAVLPFVDFNICNHIMIQRQNNNKMHCFFRKSDLSEWLWEESNIIISESYNMQNKDSIKNKYFLETALEEVERNKKAENNMKGKGNKHEYFL